MMAFQTAMEISSFTSLVAKELRLFIKAECKDPSMT